jgi:hypothetical protein
VRAALLAALLLGCGSRTGIGVPESFETAVDSAVDGADSALDTFVEDTFIDDAPLTEVGCTTDLECDDRVPCTRDVCDVAAGRCRNIPVDSECDDRVFCNGVERCDAVAGCVPTAPPNCSDPVTCTVDRCDEATRSCAHTANDALCPVSHTCDLMLGCQARAIAHTQSDLYEIRLPSGVINKIGPTTGTLTDVALHPMGTLYGVRFDGLCVVDSKTAKCGPVTPISGSPVGLDFAPDGTLYGAAGSIVYSVNRTTGMTTTVARFPAGMQASGDLAFLSTGRLLGTATGTGGPDDFLVEFDLKTGTGKPLGRTGFDCIWGLAAYGTTLYGLTCEGRVLRINPDNASSTELSRLSGVEFWGATAR